VRHGGVLVLFGLLDHTAGRKCDVESVVSS
jgi:hypothetical protein